MTVDDLWLLCVCVFFLSWQRTGNSFSDNSNREARKDFGEIGVNKRQKEKGREDDGWRELFVAEAREEVEEGDAKIPKFYSSHGRLLGQTKEICKNGFGAFKDG